MIYQKFYINKTTDTSADTLLALGFADFVQWVLATLGKPSDGIIMRNSGESQEISLPCTVAEEDLTQENLPSFSFLRPLISSKQDEKQGKKGRVLLDGVDYDRE